MLFKILSSQNVSDVIFIIKINIASKAEFIRFAAHSLFIIKMYNCDFYLNKSSPKSSKFYFLF